METKFLTRHPQGKAGVNILKRRYEAIKAAIIAELSMRDDMAFSDLTSRVQERVKKSFDGKVSWYVVTVKLDLEARGQIERVQGATPQRIRLKRRRRLSAD